MAQVRYEAMTFTASGPSTSVQLNTGERIVGVETPASWSAADICFEVARDGTNFIFVTDISVTAVNSKKYLRLTSIMTSEASLYIIPQNDLFYPWVNGLVRLHSMGTASTTEVVQTGVCQLLVQSGGL